MKRKKDFSIIEEIEGDPEHEEIPIIKLKLQDRHEEYKGLIHQGRLISDEIRVENKIPVIGLDEDEIELKIQASPDNWEKLYALGFSDPERLGRLIFLNFVEPLKEYINRDKARELKSAFMRDSKQYVAAIYVPALYWIELPSEKWPDFFKDLINEFDNSKITNRRTGKPVVSRIAHKCWAEQFEKRRKALKLDAKEDRLDFKETYIDGNPYIRPAKDYFEENNHTPTVKIILDFLKLRP